MYPTFRWFGDTDQVTLHDIRQIPGVTGIVSALYDVPIGDAWPRQSVERLAETIDRAGLRPCGHRTHGPRSDGWQ